MRNKKIYSTNLIIIFYHKTAFRYASRSGVLNSANWRQLHGWSTNLSSPRRLTNDRQPEKRKQRAGHGCRAWSPRVTRLTARLTPGRNSFRWHFIHRAFAGESSQDRRSRLTDIVTLVEDVDDEDRSRAKEGSWSLSKSRNAINERKAGPCFWILRFERFNVRWRQKRQRDDLSELARVFPAH